MALFHKQYVLYVVLIENNWVSSFMVVCCLGWWDFHSHTHGWGMMDREKGQEIEYVKMNFKKVLSVCNKILIFQNNNNELCSKKKSLLSCVNLFMYRPRPRTKIGEQSFEMLDRYFYKKEENYDTQRHIQRCSV